MNYQAYKAASRLRKAREPIDKLFVYGTLRSAYNRKLVAGQDFETETAVLYNYRRIHPRNGYPFAVHWRGSKIEGQILYGITPTVLQKIDEYEDEGTLYRRKVVRVQLGNSNRFAKAYVYVGIPEAIKPYFSKGIDLEDRLEEFVENSINKYLEARQDQCWINDLKTLSLQVRQEFLSEETHSLVRQYFHDAGLPAFIIKHELEKASLPSLAWLRTTPKAAAYADNYLTLAVKFMLVNQLEERFRHNFRAQTKAEHTYYPHTISALMALKLLVTHNQLVCSAMRQLQADRYEPSLTYVDYAATAILIAEDIYTSQRGKDVVEWVCANRRSGAVPLGAELEFSAIGGQAIGAREGDDRKYDSFYYFYDFDLMRRGWKLGAHVDDHGFLTTSHTHTRGFLELAFGRYRLLGDVSKPATHDPWILSQLIDLANRYIGIRPHSLHISLQTDPQAPFQKIHDPEYLLCLMMLGGDLREDPEGILREMRIYRHEILRPDGALYFSRINKHHKNPDDDDWTSVVEYQFPRSSFGYDYQPLIMALKGLQLEGNPYPLRDYPNCPYKQEHQEYEAMLTQWAVEPIPVSQQTIRTFLSIVERGLTKEIERIGVYYAPYVNYMLQKIEEQLTLRNKRIQDYHANRQTTTHHRN